MNSPVEEGLGKPWAPDSFPLAETAAVPLGDFPEVLVGGLAVILCANERARVSDLEQHRADMPAVFYHTRVSFDGAQDASVGPRIQSFCANILAAEHLQSLERGKSNRPFRKHCRHYVHLDSGGH